MHLLLIKSSNLTTCFKVCVMHEPISSPLWGHRGQACGEGGGARFALPLLLRHLYKVALAKGCLSRAADCHGQGDPAAHSGRESWVSGRLSYRCHAVAIRGRGDSEEGAKVASRGLAPYPERLAAFSEDGGVLARMARHGPSRMPQNSPYSSRMVARRPASGGVTLHGVTGRPSGQIQ